MQNIDFDKIFSHKFGQRTGEPYSETNWSELSQRMDMYSRRRTRWVLPALFFLIGILTGGNMFWWYQWQEAERRLQNRENRSTLLQTDTSIQGVVVYLYDTVYQNVAMAGRQKTGAPVQFSTYTPANSFSPNGFHIAGHQHQTAGIRPDLQESYDLARQVDSSFLNVQELEEQPLLNGDAAAPGHSSVLNTPVDTSELATPPLSYENPAPADSLFENPPNDKPIVIPTTKKHPLYFARPRVGASVVLGFPNFPHKRSGSVWGAGIRSDVEIARNFRLGAEVAYQQAALESDEREALDESDIAVPEPGGDYQLKYWEIYSMPAFTYNLHLRCEIPLQGNWTPWFGVGGQAITVLPFDIEYEFENEINNLELQAPAKTASSTTWQGMTIMLGVECRLNPHLYLGAESFLLQSYSKEPDLLDQQFGLKTSVLYKF